MVEGGRGPAFPVVFFDGEREMNIGDVKINPTLEYKPFQFMLSQRIGISPNQISIYLVDRNRNPKTPFSEDRRRIPITGKVNFGLICRQKDCCFLVVLKRSRKSRYRRERTIHGVEFGDYLAETEFSPAAQMHPVPGNMVLLRRNQAAPVYGQITQPELANLNDRLQSLRIQRENYQVAMAEGNLINPPDLVSNRGLETNSIQNLSEFRPVPPPPTAIAPAKIENKKVFCAECENAEKNGWTTSFHPCVNDPVTTQLTSRFGPINPIRYY